MFGKIRTTGWLTAGAFLCLAPGAFADCPTNAPTLTTACMSLMNAGDNVMANVYVGPYTASINGGVPTSVICDDFFDESFLPEFWTANVYKGSNPLTYPLTRNGQRTGISEPTLTQDYNEVGYLALQLLSAPDATTAGEIHFALWSVFDPSALLSLDTFSHSLYSGAKSYLDAAVANNGNSDAISQFTIYSANTAYPITCPVDTCGQPQEFLVKTPEPSMLALLGVDLSGVGVLFFLLRRRRFARS